MRKWKKLQLVLVAGSWTIDQKLAHGCLRYYGKEISKFYYEILFLIKLFQVFVLCFLNEMSWNCTCICKIELIFPFFFLHRWNILQSMVWRRVMRKTCLPLLKWRQRVRLVPPHTKEFSTPQDQWIHPQWMVISGSQGEIF